MKLFKFALGLVASSTLMTSAAMASNSLHYNATCAVFLNANQGGTHDNVVNKAVSISKGVVTDVYADEKVSLKIGMYGDVPGQGKDRVSISIQDVTTKHMIARSEITFDPAARSASIAELSIITGLDGGIVFSCYPN